MPRWVERRMRVGRMWCIEIVLNGQDQAGRRLSLREVLPIWALNRCTLGREEYLHMVRERMQHQMAEAEARYA